MRRRLFNIACAFSLLLSVLTFALWKRSYTHYDALHLDGFPIFSAAPESETGRWHVYPGFHAIGSCAGRLYYVTGTVWNFVTDLEEMFADPVPDFNSAMAGRSIGFGHASASPPGLSDVSIWYVPHWFPAAVFALLPLRRLIIWRQRAKALLQGKCSECGYDLRASPHRCPECGKGTISIARPEPSSAR